MKTLLIVTFVDFWNQGSGHRARISSLVAFLQKLTRITIFFAGPVTDQDKAIIRVNFPSIQLEAASPDGILTYIEYAQKFSGFIRDKVFDFAMVEYIELSSILEYLPGQTITLLDTHDLVADRINSFKEVGVEYDGIMLTKEEELEIFGCYDYIVLIQNNDFEKVSEWLDSKRLVLVPHPVKTRKKKISEQVRNIGFVASPYLPNIEALQWFIPNVWKKVRLRHDLTLNIYGNIKFGFPASAATDAPHVVFHGYVADLDTVYEDSDIIINPVRCGAGLKIKNVEALGHGLPLITTRHAATGINDGKSSCFLEADTPDEFLFAFDLLIENNEFRKQLSQNAIEYAKANFSIEKCYAAISHLII